MGFPLYRGGYADVWKGEHCGRDVAVKVIRTYSNSDLQKIIGVSRELRIMPSFRVSEYLQHHVEVLQGSRNVENSPASQYFATDRGDDV